MEDAEEVIGMEESPEEEAPDPVHTPLEEHPQWPTDQQDDAMEAVDMLEDEDIDNDELLVNDVPESASTVPMSKKLPRRGRLKEGRKSPMMETVENKSTLVATPRIEVKVMNGNAVDIEKMLTAYSPNALITRLETVMNCCPPLEKEAFIALSKHLKQNTLNTNRYLQLYSQAEGKALLKSDDVPPMDTSWRDLISASSNSALEALLLDLKRQKDEGVKESTRRAMQVLIDHYCKTGQLMEALKLFNRGMREFCSQMKHIVHMYVSWLETAVCLGEWQRVDPLVSQAERAIGDAEEAENQSASASSGRLGRVHMDAAQSVVKSNKLVIAVGKSKVDVIVGLSLVDSRKFKQACDRFLRVDADMVEEPWVVSLVDIARYGSLCALATLSRAELKTKCLDTKFRKVLESEPMLVDVLSAFSRSQFGICLDLLNSIKDAMLLDPFFSRHVNEVYRMIRNRALSQYLIPYVTADLHAMAAVFRTNVDTISNELIVLIDRGEVKARLDERESKIEMIVEDERVATHSELVETCDALIERAEWMILRAVMQQSKITVAGEEKVWGGRGGKRRTNDESGSDASSPSVLRFARSTLNSLNRVIGSSNAANLPRTEADSPSDGGEPLEPEQ